MRWENFRREFGEWIGIQPPDKQSAKPSKKETHALPAEHRGDALRKKEKPLVKLMQGESLSDFAKRAKKAYEQEGKKFDYANVLLEAVGARSKEQVIEKHSEPWFKRIKNLLTERTDMGALVQTCSLSLFGASLAIGSHYLKGDIGYLAPALFAFGGERYVKGFLQGVMYLGEDWLKRAVDTSHASLRKEIKQVFRKGTAHDVQAGLELINQRDIAFQKAKKRQENLKPWMEKMEFILPKATMAAAVTGLIPNTFPVPVPLGFQDWDGRALPVEQFNAVYQNLRTGAVSFATDVVAGIGHFGNFITEHSDAFPKAVAEVFSTTTQKATYGIAAFGVGAGLFGAEVAKGASLGVLAGTRAFYNLAGSFIESAKDGVNKLEKILHRPIVPMDVDAIRAKIKPSLPVRHIGSRKRGALPKQDSALADELIAELAKRARDQEMQSKAMSLQAEVEQKRSSQTIPAITGELKPNERLELPVAAQQLIDVSVSVDVWNLSAAHARARILEAMGFIAPQENGVAYKQFKTQLSDFIQRAGTQPLEALQKFLEEKDDKRQHVLNGENTKDNKAILMWADRQGLLKLIKKRVEEIEIQKLKDLMETNKQGQWDVSSQHQEEMALAAPLTDAKMNKEEVSRAQSVALGKKAPDAAKDTLRKIIIGRIRRTVPARPSVSQDVLQSKVPVWISQELREINSLSRAQIASRLLKEIKSATSAPYLYSGDEDEYLDGWYAARKVEMFKQDPMRVRIDENQDWLYRGSKDIELIPKKALNKDSKDIELIPEKALNKDSKDMELIPENALKRARLNIIVNPESIGALDSLIRDRGYKFFYRIGMPGSDISGMSRHDSVTIFFNTPLSKELMSLLFRISKVYGRKETADNLCGDKITSHFYIADPFTETMLPRHAEEFINWLEVRDPEIAFEVKKFIGPQNTISEHDFNAIKKTLRAFDIPVKYHQAKGVVLEAQKLKAA